MRRHFARACREYALKQVDAQRNDFKTAGRARRLGTSLSHDDAALRSRANCARLRSSSKTATCTKGTSPCTGGLNCRSALAEAEVEYEDKTSPSVYVRFEVVDRADLAQRMGLAPTDQMALFDDVPTSVAIWTTTPWTLPANQAVAVHPQFDYSLVELSVDGNLERILLATELVKPVMNTLGVSSWVIIAGEKGWCSRSSCSSIHFMTEKCLWYWVIT